jgi:hypothetical protein
VRRTIEDEEEDEKENDHLQWASHFQRKETKGTKFLTTKEQGDTRTQSCKVSHPSQAAFLTSKSATSQVPIKRRSRCDMWFEDF